MIYFKNPYCPLNVDCGCHENEAGGNNNNTGNDKYCPDKNWDDKPGCPNTEPMPDTDCSCTGNKAELLKKISELEFAITDLNLYLDTHPDCKEALEMLTKLAATLKSLKADYVKKYGTLMVTDVENETPISWVSPEHKWPWQA